MPLSVSWANAFNTGGDKYDLAALIVNPNEDTGTPKLDYIFDVQDASGKSLTKVQGTTYVNAREQFLIIKPNVALSEAPAKVTLTYVPFDWVRAGQQTDAFTIKDKVLKNATLAPELTLTIHNDAFIPITALDVFAVVSDISGNVRGVSSTYVPNIDPDMDRAITFTWPAPLASLRTGQTCSAPTDAFVVFDTSGSMDDAGGTPPEPLASAQAAAASYVDLMGPNDRTGLITFATDATAPVDQALTANKEMIKSAISHIAILPDKSQYTNLGDAIKEGTDELIANGRQDTKHALVILTDGVPNRPVNPANSNDISYAASYAANQAAIAHAKGISIYVIGFADKVNKDYLSGKIASTPSDYFAAAKASDLKDAYQKVSQVVCSEESLLSEVYIRLNGFSYL
jgi:Mg-chelatase subunit ChlD